jgi:arginyl-tRNA synthetase
LANVLIDVKNQAANWGHSQLYASRNILIEYLDPNPFKEIHIGHVYSGTVGDAIASLFELAGGIVHRVTYQGDVGLHVAKAIYGIVGRINNDPEQLALIEKEDRPKFLGETYTAGAAAYDNDEAAKAEIQALNKQIYEQSDPVINKIHATGLAWSMDYFETVYAAFGFSPFEKNYLESMVAEEGLKIVKEHIKDGVFEASNGAVIFRGEPFGLHTRVFINSQGLPTYEAKDIGNAMIKWRDYNYDKSVIITGEEQAEYFKVMLKALEQFAPEQAGSTTHIPHGTVGLSHGKMSSRTGSVIKALDLLQSTETAAKRLASDDSAPVHEVALSAIKYAFLKNRIGGDIVYDVDESLSLEGNSGTYLLYAHARACSILAKAQPSHSTEFNRQFDQWERQVVVKISEYPEVMQKATVELMPHHICTYLYELAQLFNRFYENDRVIGSQDETKRLALVSAYAAVLKNGLNALKISAPDRM